MTTIQFALVCSTLVAGCRWSPDTQHTATTSSQNWWCRLVALWRHRITFCVFTSLHQANRSVYWIHWQACVYWTENRGRESSVQNLLFRRFLFSPDL